MGRNHSDNYQEIQSVFSLNLNSLMQQRSMTNRGLAKEIGVTRGAVNNWTNGKSLPNGEYLVKLSILFQVSIDWLLMPGISRISQNGSEKKQDKRG